VFVLLRECSYLFLAWDTCVLIWEPCVLIHEEAGSALCPVPFWTIPLCGLTASLLTRGHHMGNILKEKLWINLFQKLSNVSSRKMRWYAFFFYLVTFTSWAPLSFSLCCPLKGVCIYRLHCFCIDSTVDMSNGLDNSWGCFTEVTRLMCTFFLVIHHDNKEELFVHNRCIKTLFSARIMI
jgi:hypothetical protein